MHEEFKNLYDHDNVDLWACWFMKMISRHLPSDLFSRMQYEKQQYTVLLHCRKVYYREKFDPKFGAKFSGKNSRCFLRNRSQNDETSIWQCCKFQRIFSEISASEISAKFQHPSNSTNPIRSESKSRITNPDPAQFNRIPLIPNLIGIGFRTRCREHWSWTCSSTYFSIHVFQPPKARSPSPGKGKKGKKVDKEEEERLAKEEGGCFWHFI